MESHASGMEPLPDAVRIADPDPAWEERFAAERVLLAETLGDVLVAIEHIGSTSVPGLAAKPVIDIMAGATSLDDVLAHVAELSRIGYEHRPAAFAGDRLYFRKYRERERSHHLHVVPAETLSLRNEILFRDWLRTHPDAAAEYERQKRQLAAHFSRAGRQGRQAYVEGKTAFVQAIVDAARDARGLPRADVWEP